MVCSVGGVVGGCYARDVGVTSPAEHAATELRDCIARLRGNSDVRFGHESDTLAVDAEQHIRSLAERANELERERDEARERYDLLLGEARKVNRAWKVADERAEQLEKALRQIADYWNPDSMTAPHVVMADIARAAFDGGTDA